MRLHTELTAPDGTRYLVVAKFPSQSLILPAQTSLYGLVRIPEGMGAIDYGRRFWWVPTNEDATASTTDGPPSMSETATVCALPSH